MIECLVSFKHRHPGAWSAVESVNGALFRLRYGKAESTAEMVLKDCTAAGCSYSLVAEEDLPLLEQFLFRQDEDNLKWFRPHAFDIGTLKRLYRNPSFLMMKSASPEGQIIGYFFLRCFFIGRAFAGLIVDREWQNHGIGTQIWRAEAAVCNRLGLRMQATISRDNKPSMASCSKGTCMEEAETMEDGYIAVECKMKTNHTV